MATFKVGDRVRILGASNEYMRRYAGLEGRIIAEDSRVPGFWNIDAAFRDHDGIIMAWHPMHLAPILPERNQITTWAECPWRPEHLRNPESIA